MSTLAPAWANSGEIPAKTAAADSTSAARGFTLLHLFWRHDRLPLKGIARIAPRLQRIAVLGQRLEYVLIRVGPNVEHGIVPGIGDRQILAIGRQVEPFGELGFGPALATTGDVADVQANRLDDQRLPLIPTGRVPVQTRREPRQVRVRAAIHVEAPAAGAFANHQDFIF